MNLMCCYAVDARRRLFWNVDAVLSNSTGITIKLIVLLIIMTDCSSLGGNIVAFIACLLSFYHRRGQGEVSLVRIRLMHNPLVSFREICIFDTRIVIFPTHKHTHTHRLEQSPYSHIAQCKHWFRPMWPMRAGCATLIFSRLFFSFFSSCRAVTNGTSQAPNSNLGLGSTLLHHPHCTHPTKLTTHRKCTHVHRWIFATKLLPVHRSLSLFISKHRLENANW